MENDEPCGPSEVNAEWSSDEDVIAKDDGNQEDSTTGGASGETVECCLLNDDGPFPVKEEKRAEHNAEN